MVHVIRLASCLIVVSVCLPSDTLSQCLPSYLGFSYLGCGVSLHGRSSKAQLLLLTLNFCGLSQTACFCVVLFIIGDWNAKVGSQETPGITGKFGLGVRNEAGQRLTEFCQENALVISNTLLQQHKTRPYTWTSPDGQYQNQIDYILYSQRWRSSIQSAKTTPGADCKKQYQELTMAEIMNSLLPNSDLNERK